MLTKPKTTAEVTVKFTDGSPNETVTLHVPKAGILSPLRVKVSNHSLKALAALQNKDKKLEREITHDDGLMHAEVVKACLPEEYAEWTLEEVFVLTQKVKMGAMSALVSESYSLIGFDWFKQGASKVIEEGVDSTLSELDEENP